MLSLKDFKNAQELGDFLNHHNSPIFELSHKLATQIFDGQSPNKTKGQGDDFWQFRNFENLEPAANIDWRISAKFDKLLVREYEHQKPLQISIWCDLSPKMFYKSKNYKSKANIAIIFALALFIGLSKHKIKVCNNKRKISKDTDFIQNILLNGNVFPTFDEKIPHIIITDGMDEIDNLKRQINEAKNIGIKLLYIIINDKTEIDFDLKGDLLFENFENKEKLRINDCIQISKEYQNKIKSHFIDFEQNIKNANFSMVQFYTDANLIIEISKTWNCLINFLGNAND